MIECRNLPRIMDRYSCNGARTQLRMSLLGDDRPRQKQSSLVHLLALKSVPQVCCVMACCLQNISVFLSWIGSFFGAPELMMAPCVLLLSGAAAGPLNLAQRTGVIVLTSVTMAR